MIEKLLFILPIVTSLLIIFIALYIGFDTSILISIKTLKKEITKKVILKEKRKKYFIQYGMEKNGFIINVYYIKWHFWAVHYGSENFSTYINYPDAKKYYNLNEEDLLNETIRIVKKELDYKEKRKIEEKIRKKEKCKIIE